MPELSFYDVEALLRQTASKDVPQSSTKSWLTPNDTVALLVALDHDADEVYLVGMGRKFAISYKGDKVWLSPTDGNFVPCGWFTPNTLRKHLGELHVVAAV